jgi:hypothetical protein
MTTFPTPTLLSLFSQQPSDFNRRKWGGVLFVVRGTRQFPLTFLADSSASLGRPYFYFIQSNGWKRIERTMGGGLTIHNNQPHGQMHTWHRGGVISMMMMMTMMRTTTMMTITSQQ